MRSAAPTTSAPPSGTPFVPCDDVVTVLASSSSGHFERDPTRPSVIRLAALAWADEADAKANVPSGWTLANAAEVVSASVSSGLLTWTSTAAVKSFYNGTDTVGRWTRQLTNLGPMGMEYVVRIGGSTIPNEQNVVFALTAQIAAQLHIAVDVYNNGGTYRLRCLYDNTGATNLDTCTLAQAQAGIWYRIRIVHGYFFVWYNKTLGGVIPPTESQWTLAFFRAMSGAYLWSFSLTNWYYLFTATTNANGQGTWQALFASERPLDVSNRVGYAPFRGRGFAATSDVITLIASGDYGAAKGLPLIALARKMAKDAINRLPGDSALWTLVLVGDDSDPTPGPGSATYADADTFTLQDSSGAVISTAKRYWAWYAQAASASGTEPGSIDLSILRGLFAAAA